MTVEAEKIVEANAVNDFDDTGNNAELLDTAEDFNEELLNAALAPMDQGMDIEAVNVAKADSNSRRTVEQFLAWKRNRSRGRDVPCLNLERTINLTLPVNSDLETVFGVGATRLALEYFGPELTDDDAKESSATE